MSGIRIPGTVQAVLQRLNEAGFAAFAVGGCVRDSLLGLPPKDWDICTAARPEETAALFPRTLLTGAKYGTVTVLEPGGPFEVTTFRKEGDYEDSRHPEEVEFLPALEGDLSRRDFTVNAMAADREGNVTDLFRGREDLKSRILRCVGTSETRFSEDALRILRALRFASQLDFAVEEETGKALIKLRSSLSAVAPERIHKELVQLMQGPGACRVLEEFAPVFAVIVPELEPCMGFDQHNFHHTKDVWGHTLAALREEKSGDADLRLALLLHDIGKPAAFTLDENSTGHFYGHAEKSAELTDRILLRLRFDNAAREEITALVAMHHRIPEPMTRKAMSRLLGAHEERFVRKLLALRRCDALGTGTVLRADAEEEERQALALLEELLREKACLRIPDLSISGRDLLALGVPEGPEIGRILQGLLDAVLEEQVENQKPALMEYAQQKLLQMKNN